MLIRYNACNDLSKRTDFTDNKLYRTVRHIPGYFLLTENDNGIFEEPTPISEKLFDVAERYSERLIVCPQCGNKNCYSGTAYDQCDKCGYLRLYGQCDCACCGAMSLFERDSFEVCPVCGWEDDNLQRDRPDYSGGANWLSLNLARENWKKHGVTMTEKDEQEKNAYYKANRAADGS